MATTAQARSSSGTQASTLRTRVGLSWHDRGEAERRMLQGLDAGKLSFTLRGRKLRGSWTLVRTSRGPQEWLLIKHRDAEADDQRDILDDDKSIVSGLSIAQLQSGRLPDPSLAAGAPSIGKPARMPASLKPMLAHSVDGPFSSPDWLFEPKLDGFRALAFLKDGKARLLSRSGRDMTKNFPAIAEELAVLPHGEMIVDGEIVALGADGMPDFRLLQNNAGTPRLRGDRDPSGRAALRQIQDERALIAFYPFDILYLNGRDLRQVPLFQRKHVLKMAIIPSEHVKTVEYVESSGEDFYRAIEHIGLEGIIAKRRDSRYETSERSRNWLKIKRVLSQEFVIAGYTKGEGRALRQLRRDRTWLLPQRRAHVRRSRRQRLHSADAPQHVGVARTSRDARMPVPQRTGRPCFHRNLLGEAAARSAGEVLGVDG